MFVSHTQREGQDNGTHASEWVPWRAGSCEAQGSLGERHEGLGEAGGSVDRKEERGATGVSETHSGMWGHGGCIDTQRTVDSKNDQDKRPERNMPKYE